MKILFCSNQARSTRLVWRPLLQELVAKGHDVCVLVPEVSSDTSAQDIQKLTEIAALSSDSFNDNVHHTHVHKGHLQVRTYPLVRRGKQIFQEIRSFYTIMRLIRQEQPQQIFATTIKPILYTALALRLLGKKIPAPFFICITGLGYCFEQNKGLPYTLAKILYTLALPRAKRIFFLNKHDKEYFLEKGIIHLSQEKKCLCLNSTGIDTVHFAFEKQYPTQPTFLLMARMLKSKGVEDFVKAAKLLRKQYPQARFQLLGPTEEGLGAVPLAHIQAWHTSQVIEYLGFMEDVRPAIAKASVMVLPSWREGIPCAILEGMSMGRAAVVSAVPGCMDVIENGMQGFVVPHNNVHALANALEFFIVNPSSIVSMGHCARKKVETNFTTQHMLHTLQQHMPMEV